MRNRLTTHGAPHPRESLIRVGTRGAPHPRESRIRVGTRGALLTLLLAAGLLVLVRVPTVTLEQAESTGTVGELIGGMEVGQTFVSRRARLSGVAFSFATFSNRENTVDVLFELRASPESPTVLRTAQVNARALKDHERHLFRFDPLADSEGQTYYASLRSPTARAGNAVTISYSNQNPDHQTGSSQLYLLRGAGPTPPRLRGAVERAAVLRASAKSHADATFAVVHEISLGDYLARKTTHVVGYVYTRPREVGRWGLFALAGALVAGISVGHRRFSLRGRAWFLPCLVSGIVVLGVLLRLVFAERLPLTNDEGSFLYDAWALAGGRLPGGDGVLKTPTTLAVLAGLFSVVPPSLWLGRLVSVLASVLTVVPLYGIASRLFGTRAGARAASTFWLLTAVAAIFGVYLHAQPLQILFGTLGLWVWAVCFDPRRSRWSSWYLSCAAGALLALALGARKTSAALVLPAVAIAFLSPVPGRVRTRVVAGAVLGLGVTVAGLGLAEWLLYGRAGLNYFLGLDIAAIDPRTTASAEERQNALIKGLLPILREGLPVLALAAIAVGGFGERLVRWIAYQFTQWRRAADGPLLPRLAWVVPVLGVWGSRRFLLEHAQPEHLRFGVGLWWTALLACLALCALVPRADRPGARPNAGLRGLALPVLVPLGWLAGVAVLYGSWIKFTANYLAEFIPPLVLLAAAGVVWIRESFGQRVLLRAVLLVLLFWGGWSAARSGYAFEHTGTFERSALEEAAAFLRARVPPAEPILTAAVAIPALSGHRVVHDVAHPTHYAYGFIEPHVRNIYMVPAEVMVCTVLQDVQWVIRERLTAFSYFREYPAIEELVNERFVTVRVIENGSNPITILRRNVTGYRLPALPESCEQRPRADRAPREMAIIP